MQTASQRAFNHGSEVRRPKAGKNTDVRGSTLRAIHATWRKICDLEGDDLRDARLVFATKALNLKKPLKSTGQLSPAQLGKILDAMREKERAPALPGVRFTTEDTGKQETVNDLSSVNSGAEIIHLATAAQVKAIEKLRVYLGWSEIGMNAFIGDKFRRASSTFLTPAQANSCTMILMTIAARRRIKDRGFQEKISRALIRAEIPALKRDLGIDQKPFITEGTQDEHSNG